MLRKDSVTHLAETVKLRNTTLQDAHEQLNVIHHEILAQSPQQATLKTGGSVGVQKIPVISMNIILFRRCGGIIDR